ncbi:MAG: NAD-dependent DNA ligase LigA [Acidobacteriota bacterium]|nr:NAD-dependent DNA ligase LigA [Acidobacteriota bacterium]
MKLADARKRAEELRREIERHDYLYYVRDAPRVSDEAYDLLFRELKELESDFPSLQTRDSPTRRVGGKALESFDTVEHLAPMLSLDSHPDDEQVRKFDERVRKGLQSGAEVAYVVEPKLDGASVELVYEDGVFVRGTTRGDGRVGEDVTENLRTIPAVPLKLRSEEREFPSAVAFRGEVIMRIGDFERLNERLVGEGREPYANPRNVAAGALRQLDPKVTAERPLDVYLYDILAGDVPGVRTQWQLLEALRGWGLRVNDLPRRVESVEEIVDYHRSMVDSRDDIGYEIDGVVIKLDDLAFRQELGVTSHHPRWAFAFKFAPRKEVTRVLGILASVGRTGAVTPVAMLRPVELGGVTVSRASLHNRDEVARKDIREGDRVRVERAGDVIPQVVERIPERGRRRKRRFSMPEGCPSCGTRLVERGPFSICPNSFECPAQLAGRLIHFASRRGLDIEGLGEEGAKLFVEKGLVRHLPDLFELRAESLVGLEGYGDKSATNLVAAIKSAARVELHRFLYALGIPEVGATVARDLALEFRTFEAVRRAGGERLQEVDGIGPKMAEQITSFFAEPHNSQVLDQLLAGGIEVMEAVEPERSEGTPTLAGKKFVFTGGMERLSRPQAKKLVEDAGGRVVSSVSKATDYVVAGDKPGSKLGRARALGVAVLDEDRFILLVEEMGAAGHGVPARE